MKVLVLNDFVAFPGGGTSVAHFTAEVLAERGHEVSFLAGRGSVEDRVGAAYPIESLGLSDVRDQPKIAAAVNGVFRLSALGELRRRLARFPPEDTKVILHQWTRVLSPGVFWALRRHQVLVYAHDYFLACPTGAMYRFDMAQPCTLRPLSGACVRSACDRESRLHKMLRIVRLAVQNALVKRMRRLTVIFVSLGQATRYGSIFPASAQRRTLANIPVQPPARPPIDPSDAKTQALFVGRLVAEKGVEDLAGAAREAGVQCTFVGDGPRLDALRAAFPEHLWLGWKGRAEVAQLMRDACVLVLPSRWPETAGLVVLEALQQGTPALVSRVVCASDDLAGALGVTIYDPFQPGELTQALRRAASQAPHMKQQVAAEQARASFDDARSDYGRRLEAILLG